MVMKAESGPTGGPSMGRREGPKWAIVPVYAADWLVTLGVGGAFFALGLVSGFKRDFSVEDTSLRHPHVLHERVPTWALSLICLVAPITIQWLVNILTVRSLLDAHHSTLGALLSLAITGAITQFTKVTVGRPRPDLLARCIVLQGAVDPPNGLSTVAICTQTDHYILKDGFRSFPSGHSSLSFAGLGFLSFYLAGKLHLYKLPVRGHAIKAWICVTPLCGAGLVGITRTMDYRHHWSDAFAGSILGLAVSYLSYRLYYPPFAAKFSHRPHGPRVPQPVPDPVLPFHSQLSSLNGEEMIRSVQSPGPVSDDHGVNGIERQIRSPAMLDNELLASGMPRVWKETLSERDDLEDEEAQ